MTLAREPLTFSKAISTIAGKIDYPSMAQIVDRSERLVRKWSHPQSNAHPTVAQGVALDLAYIEAGGDTAPISETYLQLLDRGIGERMANRLALTAAVASAVKESGDAFAAVLAVTHPGAGPREVHRAEHELEEAQSAMAVVGRRLSSFHPLGAGPSGETVGGTQ